MKELKKEKKTLLILTIILVIISAFVILTKGNTYTVPFELYGKQYENYNLILDHQDNIEILEEKIENEKYLVTIKSKKPGKVFMSIETDGDTLSSKSIYVHKSMIITDNNYFGKSNGCEILPICFTILLSYILYMLIKSYKISIKKNLYQYRNITYLWVIIFVSFFVLSNFLSIFNYNWVYDTITKSIGSMSSFSIILLPIALITFTFVTISNIVLIIKEWFSVKNLLGLFMWIFLCVSTFLPDWVYRFLLKSHRFDIYNQNWPWVYIYDFVESLVYLTVVYLECIFIGTIVIALKAARKKLNFDKDYIIILWCKMRKDGSLTNLLKWRVDKAIDFRNKQLKAGWKDLIFVPSGGKGSDEVISEAEAMKNYLIKKWIDEKNILIEDKAKNTYENIKFSNKLINNKNANIAFSTTKYHILRAGLLATEQWLYFEWMWSKTKIYFWINAFIREFIWTLYTERKKHRKIIFWIVLLIIFMITVTYFANNI